MAAPIPAHDPFYSGDYVVAAGSKYRFDRQGAAAQLGFQPGLFSTFRNVGAGPQARTIANYPTGIAHPHGYSNFLRAVAANWLRARITAVRANPSALETRRRALEAPGPVDGLPLAPAGGQQGAGHNGRVLEIAESITRSTMLKDGATRPMFAAEDWSRWAAAALEPRLFESEEEERAWRAIPRSNGYIGGRNDDVYAPAAYDMVFCEDAYFHAEPDAVIRMMVEAVGVEFIFTAPRYRKEGRPAEGEYLLGEHVVQAVPGLPYHVRAVVRDPARSDGAYPPHWVPWLRAGTWAVGDRLDSTLVVRNVVFQDADYEVLRCMVVPRSAGTRPWGDMLVPVAPKLPWPEPRGAYADMVRTMALAVSGAHSSTDKGRKQIAFRAGLGTDHGKECSAEEMTRAVNVAMETARRAHEAEMRREGRIVDPGALGRLLARFGWDAAQDATAAREAGWRGFDGTTGVYTEFVPPGAARLLAAAAAIGVGGVATGAAFAAALRFWNALMTTSALAGAGALVVAAAQAPRGALLARAPMWAPGVVAVASAIAVAYITTRPKAKRMVAALAFAAPATGGLVVAAMVRALREVARGAERTTAYEYELARRGAPMLGPVRAGCTFTLKASYDPKSEYYGYVRLAPQLSSKKAFVWHGGDAGNFRAGLSRHAPELPASTFVLSDEAYARFAELDDRMADGIVGLSARGWGHVSELGELIEAMDAGAKRQLYRRVADALEFGADGIEPGAWWSGPYSGTLQIKSEPTFKEKVRLVFGDSLLAVLMEMKWWAAMEAGLAGLGITYSAGQTEEEKTAFLIEAERQWGEHFVAVSLDGVAHDAHRQEWWRQLMAHDFKRYVGALPADVLASLRREGSSHTARGVGRAKIAAWGLVMWLSGLRGTYAHNTRVTRFVISQIAAAAGLAPQQYLYATTGDDMVLCVDARAAHLVSNAVLREVGRNLGYEAGLEGAVRGAVGVMYAGSVSVRLPAGLRFKPDPLRLWDRISGATINAPVAADAERVRQALATQRLADMALARGVTAPRLPVFWAMVHALQERAREMGKDARRDGRLGRDEQRVGISAAAWQPAAPPTAEERAAYAEAWGVDEALQVAIEDDILSRVAAGDWNADLTQWDAVFRGAVENKRRADILQATLHRGRAAVRR